MYKIKISGDDRWQRFGLIDLKASQDHIYLNGFNYVRWHSTIPDETFLDVADTLGILMHIEFGFKVILGRSRHRHY